jgi:spore coat-associated protein N
MSLKKKLGMGIATAVLGIGLIGGGTFAYFSDAETTNNTFAAGTLDLSVDPTTIIDVANIKPGDIMPRHFELINDGSLDISSVDLYTEYSVEYGDNYTGGDMGEHILVHFMTNVDKNGLGNIVLGPNNVITSTTLAELAAADGLPDAVENELRDVLPWLGDLGAGERSGLEAGDSDDLIVVFEFVDNGEDQNTFQDATLSLEWTFDAQQTAGEIR